MTTILNKVSDSQKKPVDSQPPDRCESIRFVAEDPAVAFEQIAHHYPQQIPFLRMAMRHLVKANDLVGFGMHGQIFGHSLADFEAASDLNEKAKFSLKTKIRECILDCAEEHETIVTAHSSSGNDQRLCTIALPLSQFTDEEIDVVVAFAFAARTESEVTALLAELRCELMLAMAHMPATHSEKKQKRQPVEQADLSNDFKATGHLGRIGSTREFAFKLVHEFVEKFECQQVALGLTSRNSVDVFAVSGLDSFKANSPGIVNIQQAMDECRDASQVIVHQTEGNCKEHRSLPIHECWSRTTRASVCSIPLLADEKCVAVLSLSREPELGFSDDDIDKICKSVESFGPAIEMAIRGDRTLTRHTLDSLFNLVNEKTVSGKLLRIAIFAAMLVFCFGRMPYRPATVCQLVPAETSQTTAPFDAKLMNCFVSSGEAVKKGDVLARFDSQQLQLEQESLVAKIEQLKTDVRKALNEDDVAGAYLAKANASSLEHELSTVRAKIELCTITAPSDGVVVNADLDQKIGQVFPQGEQVLTFSPMQSWELQMEVPENLARHIKKDQTGSFCLNAWPGKTFVYQIDHVSAGAELVDGQNIFVAIARVEGSREFFRQGMEGIARTTTDWRPITWVAFRGAYEYLHQNFWF